MAERNVSVRLSARVDAYAAAMKAASASTMGFSRATQRNFANVGSQMMGLGRNMTTFITAPLALMGVAAVKSAMDWESSWAGVTKTVDGTTSELADLEAGLRDMAKELPATHTEIAKVAEAAGALGVATPDIEEFTRVMIDLGETTNLSADEAATSIAKLMNVMRIAPGDVDNLGSALVDLGNNGASTEAEILDMATRISGAAAVVGMSAQDVLGLANGLASLGIEAELGGTAISRVMTEIDKSVSIGGDRLALFAETAGMSASQFSAAWQADPTTALLDFIDGLGRIDAAGGSVDARLGELGLSGTRVGDVLKRLVSSGDLLSGSIQMSNDAWGENVALTDEAAKRYGTTAAQFEIVRNKIVDLFIDLGTMMLPAISAIVDVAGDLAEAFQRLPAPLQVAVGALAALAATMGPLIFVAGSFVRNFVLLRTTMATLSGPITGVSGALGALAVAAGTAYAAWKILDGGHLNASAHINTAADALDRATTSGLNEATAAGEAQVKVDALALAHKALSQAILANADDDLANAFRNFNVAATETLDVLLGLGDGATEMDQSLALISQRFGVGITDAKAFFDNIIAGGEPSAEMIHAVATELGTTDQAIRDAAAELHVLTQYGYEHKNEIAEMADAYLDTQVALGGTARDAVLAAQAIAGNREEGINAIAVYEEYVRQLAEMTPAQREAAGVTDESTAAMAELNTMVAATGETYTKTIVYLKELAPGLDSTATKAENLAGATGLLADKMRDVGPKIQGVEHALKALTFDNTTKQIGFVADAAAHLADKLQDVGPKIVGVAEPLKSLPLDTTTTKVAGLADAVGPLAEKFRVAADEVVTFDGVAGDSIDTLTYAEEAFDDAARAAGNFGDELERLTGKAIGVSDAEDALWDTALGFNDALAAQDEELGHVNRSLDRHTAEGLANVDMYKGWRDNILDLAAARLADGESIETVAADVLYNTGVMEDNAVAAGFNKDEFDALLVSWGLTPAMVKTAIVQADMKTSREDLEDLLAKYDDIPPEVATEIQTLIDNGMYDAAAQKLYEIQLARIAEILTSAPDATSTNDKLNYVARNRSSTVTVGADASSAYTTFANFVAAVRGAYIVAHIAAGYQHGGFVNTATPAVVGEAGPEVVLPLTDPARMASLLNLPAVGPRVMAAMAGHLPMHASGGGGGGSSYTTQHVTIHLHNPNGDDVLRALQNLQRRRGPLPLKVA